MSKPADDYLETSLDLNEFLVQNRAATFLMRVDDDSMKDAGILDRDLLVVDRAAKPVSGSIVVVFTVDDVWTYRLQVPSPWGLNKQRFGNSPPQRAER